MLQSYKTNITYYVFMFSVVALVLLIFIHKHRLERPANVASTLIHSQTKTQTSCKCNFED